MAQVSEYISNVDASVVDSIPESLLYFVRQSGVDPNFREKYAQLEQTWSSLSDIYARGEAVLADPRAEGIHRTLNGAIMLGRNLVSVAKAGTLAWDSGASTQVISIIQTLLELKDQSPGATKIFNSSLQFLANMSNQSSNTPEVITKIFDGVLTGTPAATLDKLLERLEPSAAAPLLLIVDSCLRHSSVNCLKFYESDNGQTIFRWILNLTPIWYDLSNDIFINFVSLIIHHIIEFGYASQFLTQAIESETYEPTQVLSLLKLLDAGLADISLFEFAARKDLFDPIYTLFEETSKKAVPYMIHSKDNDKLSKDESAPIFHTWNLLIILLDFLEALLSDRIADAGQGTNEAIVQYAITQKPIVKALIDLFHVAQVHLPKANKLGEYVQAQTSETAESHTAQHTKFPLVKARIITLLGILTMGNRAVQDEIRERQGLELVLSNCIIDIHNPFIKERAIICLRYLLENNPENQAFVAKLEAKSTVTEEALDEAGLETEIIDGKIALKKKARVEEV
ncbi:conserved hypothetical protein [Geotrichum candidum]|uniref:Ataxin-10 homolog n=1 Tax=Geotrichum candidum TaxID=1173061 RepID=A0A0J9XAU1_GEOCN|nr:conserved hypothetical protein [Geotrichum candidum]